jgi:hypothetical protein
MSFNVQVGNVGIGELKNLKNSNRVPIIHTHLLKMNNKNNKGELHGIS